MESAGERGRIVVGAQNCRRGVSANTYAQYNEDTVQISGNAWAGNGPAECAVLAAEGFLRSPTFGHTE